MRFRGNRGALLALCALSALCASGCENPERAAITKSYEKAVKESKADCVAKGGDEFLPYGAISWIGFMQSNSMSDTWRCRRMERLWKRPLAVYKFTLEGTEVKVETR